MALSTRDVAGVSGFDPLTRSFTVVASTRAPVVGFEAAVEGEQPKERLEVLESWDLGRFLENPVVLRDHDTQNIDAIIGRASDVRETPAGLEMTITLASIDANPDTARIEAMLAEGLLRGVSVGFTFGERTDEERDGQTVAVFRRNVLNEVSLVTVPADAGALVHTDGRELTWKDYGLQLFKLRERWIETGSAADKERWRAASAEYWARFDCGTCSLEGRLCHCTFDGSPKPSPERKEHTMSTRSQDYEAGKRDAEAAMQRLRPRTVPRHLRPLNELTTLGMSKVPLEQTQQAQRAHFDAEDAEIAHARERERLHAKVREGHARERERLLHTDAREEPNPNPRAPVDVCPVCYAHVDATGTCPNCGASMSLVDPETAQRLRQGQARRVQEVPPWKRSLTMTSETRPPLPSQARSFPPHRQRGAFDRPRPEDDDPEAA